MPRYGTDVDSITVLILGGWSPGPLLYLKGGLNRQCSFLEPRIPMPPVGWSWCLTWGMALLILVIGLTTWACVSLAILVQNRAWLVGTRLLLIAICVVLTRLCIAMVVRESIAKGIQTATTCTIRRNVQVVIGFSWGGGVVAEMLRLGLVGGQGQPAVLVIAPTSALIALVAMKTDPALAIRVPDGSAHRVHIFNATDDQAFCPHSDRWDLTGATTRRCIDNHVFCRRESVNQLMDVLSNLVQYTS